MSLIERRSMYQKTLTRSLKISGKALHSGRLVDVEIKPAAVNTGIIFKRTDSHLSKPFKAHAAMITSTELSTTMGEGASCVSTVEHLMAALFLMGIDNALVEISGPEVPILDGSAQPFVEKMVQVGTKEQNAFKTSYRVTKEATFSLGASSIKIEPAEVFSAEVHIDFNRDVIGKQKAVFVQGAPNLDDLVAARTFCHINDVNAMRRRGLALGGSLENAVVISDTGIVNEEGLRSSNEFAEHKLLDLIGDMYLLGKPLIGKITAHKPGHTLHANFMWELLGELSSSLTEETLVFPATTKEQELYAFG